MSSMRNTFVEKILPDALCTDRENQEGFCRSILTENQSLFCLSSRYSNTPRTTPIPMAKNNVPIMIKV